MASITKTVGSDPSANLRRLLVQLILPNEGPSLGFVADGYGAVAMTPPEAKAGPIDFVDGAEVEQLSLRHTPAFGGPSASPPTVTLSGPQVADLWRLRLTHPMQACEVVVWWIGEDVSLWDEVYRGTPEPPSWTLDEERGTVSVELPLGPLRRPDEAPFPPTLIGDSGRFPSATPDESRSHAVPVLYGTVKGVPLFAISSEAAATVNLLIAGHNIQDGTVTVFREGAPVTGGLTVVEDIDGRGSPYSYVAVTQAVYGAGSADFYLDAVNGYEGPGGKLINRLGDVLDHLYATYGRDARPQLDQRRITGAAVDLNRITVAFWVNEQEVGGTLAQFVESELAGQFPFVVGSPTGRLGWDSLLLPQQGTPPVDHLTYGLDAFERVGPTETDAAELLGEIDLAFAQHGYDGGPTLSLHLDFESAGIARRVKSRWQAVRRTSLDVPYAADESTAYLIATDLLNKDGIVRFRVEYQTVPERYWRYPVLSVVYVTDTELGWSAVSCYLEAVYPNHDGSCGAMLITVDGL